MLLAKVLLRCWFFGFIVLLFWFGAVMLAGDFVYGVHGNMFDLTRPQLNSIHYGGMGLLKRVVAMFYFAKKVVRPTIFPIDDDSTLHRF